MSDGGVNHLKALIETARSAAESLGAPGREVARRLAEAGRLAGQMADPGGPPDEGIRPQDLTTENDGGTG